MRQTLVAGNWKMNGSKESIQSLLSGITAGMSDVKNAAVVVCAPYIYIPMVAEQLADSDVSFGAENISEHDAGAFTGEISASMLNDFGTQYVIVGHSERRSLYGEQDADTANKYAAVRKAGMKPILCLGESLEEREGGITEDVVARQLDAVLELEGVESLSDAVIAYEPVWAIGTGVTASPEQAQEVHNFIRGKIAAMNADIAEKVQILYGGSMNAGNADELLSMADIDGGLIGGASLKAEDFLAICKAG
ncbi:MAG TPA: triose-phosphate isomerase [Leucothrix mucor]|nr:triose-phosphate isomerase [Leucothrix mucor]